MANYTAVTQQGFNVANTPYEAYGGELVSPINAQQNTGIGAVNAASGIQNPYNYGAAGLASASASTINPMAVDPSLIQQYESPYQNDVINATEAAIRNQNQQQASSLTGNAISSGAFGGDRAGVAQAALAGQQDIANNATIASLENQNYAQALGEANTQQAVGLSAAQNTAARELAASQQFGQLGNTAQSEALNEANAQTNAGTLQQTTQQAQDTAAYNQFLQKQAYPFETTGWLANIVEGIGSQSGGSSTGTTTQEGNAGSGIVGGLLGLASFLNRGGRVSRATGGIVGGRHYDAGGGIYIPPQDQIFDPTALGGPTGLGGGAIVPQISLPRGNTIPKPPNATAPSQPQTPQQQAQAMSQMGRAVQGIGNKFMNSPMGDHLQDYYQDTQAGDAFGSLGDYEGLGSTSPDFGLGADSGVDALASDSGVLDGGLDLGFGGIGAMARGGGIIPKRRHFMGGGGTNPASYTTYRDDGTFGSYGYGMAPQQKPQAAPTPVSDPKPANAPSYSVFPVQMSDGSWTTTQNLEQGAPPVAGGPLLRQPFAQGGLAARRHYDDGGDVLAPDVSPGIAEALSDNLYDAAANSPYGDLSPVNAPASPYGGLSASGLDTSVQPAVGAPEAALAAAMQPSAGIGTVPANSAMADMPIEPNTGLGMANAEGIVPTPTPVDRTADFGALSANTPMPPPRPAGLGAPPADDTFNRMIGIESGGRQFNADGSVVTSPKGAVGIAQVMPATGPEAAGYAGLPWDPKRFVSDKAYNLALGRAYYDHQLQTYGSPDKAAAAYNAGPAAVDRAIALASKNGGSYTDYLPKETRAYVAGATNGAPPDALAFDSSTGRNGGIASAPAVQAIDRGIASGAATPQVSLPQFPESVATTPESGKTGLLGFNFSPETRQMMLAAGLGIMGGTSRSLGVNIGQGALAGINNMRQWGNTASEIALRQAQTQSAQIENQIKAQQLKLMMDALNGHADAVAGAAKSAEGAVPSPTTPTMTAPGVANPTSASSSAPAAAPLQLDPEFDPAVIARKLEAEKWINPQAAQADRERLNQIVQSGRSRDIHGNIVNLPGFADAEAQVAGEKEFAQGNARNATMPAVDPATGAKYVGGSGQPVPTPLGGASATPGNAPAPTPFSVDPETAAVHTSIPAAPAGGGYIVPNLPRGAKLTELPEATKEQMTTDGEFQKEQIAVARSTPVALARTQALAQAFKNFESGALVNHQEAAATLALALGQPKIAKMALAGDPAAVQWVEKEGVNSVLDTLKAATPRFAQSEFNKIAETGTPNPTNQPQSNHEMVAEMLALSERNKDFLTDWQKAKQQGWSSPSAFYTAWSDANPLNGYIKAAQRQIGNFAGMPLPDSKDWAAGAVYVAPKQMTPATGALLKKYGVQPGAMFRYNGRNASQPVVPIGKSEAFSAQLGQ